MTQSNSIPSDERIVDAMIALARTTESDRMIVAGSNSSDVFSELRRRGYQRVTTTKACRVPRGQHDVALIVWREHSITAHETTLDQLTHFLNARGALVVWISPRQHMAHNAHRFALQRVGFRIESGTCCDYAVPEVHPGSRPTRSQDGKRSAETYDEHLIRPNSACGRETTRHRRLFVPTAGLYIGGMCSQISGGSA